MIKKKAAQTLIDYTTTGFRLLLNLAEKCQNPNKGKKLFIIIVLVLVEDCFEFSSVWH